MKTDVPTNNTVLATPGGSIELSSGNAGSHLNITHPSGSNVQFTNSGTSSFNSTKYQELTLEDKYSTTYGDNSSFTQGTKETRVIGDSVEFTGPSSLLIEDSIDQWYEEYGNGYGSFKMQWQDNRMSLTTADYPTNTVFNKPDGLSEDPQKSTFVYCPPLLDGSFKDNKRKEKPKTPGDYSSMGMSDSQQEFENKMMSSNNKDTLRARLQRLRETSRLYNDLATNSQSIHSSGIKL